MKDKETERPSWDWDEYANRFVPSKANNVFKRFLKKQRRRLRRIKDKKLERDE
jgi:hypothetical protein